MRSLIGVALQEAALDPLLTGRDHLRLQATLQGVPKAERRSRAEELLERVGLGDAADRKVSGYSGGMKRRLDLALALVHTAADPLPRRADDRPRPAEPHGALGGGRAAAQRRGRHRLPDDAVPRGGRRPRRPRRDHRPGQARRRGHAGRAQGRDRAAERARHPARREGRGRGSPSSSPSSASRSRRRATSRCGCATASGSPTSCARSTRTASTILDLELRAAVARRRLPREDGPHARGRDGGGGRGESRSAAPSEPAGRRSRRSRGAPSSAPLGSRRASSRR